MCPSELPSFLLAAQEFDVFYIMLPIYPARELPIPGVCSEMILDKVTLADKQLVAKEDLMAHLATRKLDCLITFGAGDIDRFIEPIEQYLRTLC